MQMSCKSRMQQAKKYGLLYTNQARLDFLLGTYLIRKDLNVKTKIK